MGLYENGDFLMSSKQNLREVVRGNAVMCSVSYVDYAVHFEEKLRDVNGVPSFKIEKDGKQVWVKAEDFVFIPYMGRTRRIAGWPPTGTGIWESMQT